MTTQIGNIKIEIQRRKIKNMNIYKNIYINVYMQND